jgi:DNA-binding transcriptional ArsR family regulator
MTHVQSLVSGTISTGFNVSNESARDRSEAAPEIHRLTGHRQPGADGSPLVDPGQVSTVLTSNDHRSILRYVPKYQVTLDRMFHALGDSSRRAMVERLARGPASVTELSRPLDMSLPTVVQHLGVLESAGIVTSTKVGRVRTYQLVPAALKPAAQWIGRQQVPAERRLDRLGSFLKNQTTDKET